MQALYEVDVTGHDIDEIQLHLGTSRRRELELFFRQARRSARAAVSSITFLARNTNPADGDDALAQFQTASHKAVDDWIEQPDADDVDVADAYIAFERANIEQQLRQRLSDYRTQAEAVVTESLALSDDRGDLDAATRELKADLGELADASPLSALFDKLDLQERNAIRQIESSLNDVEKAATDSLLDMLRHAERLSRGVVDHQEAIDPYIAEAAPAFPINQLASIDRAVLRVAMQELLYEPEVPYKAVINEAVDIAKEYGGPNSGRFVNGVLRTISDRLQQAKKSAAG
jgi:N utilization substance protein B